MEINTNEVAVETIQNVAVEVTFSQHKWTTERTHQQVTKEVKNNHGASGKAGTYKVNLANGFERELQSLTRPMSRAYHTHMRMTMAWDAGRNMSATRQIDYLTAMAMYEKDLADAKTDLLPKLPSLIATAIQRNSGLCSQSDYPTPQQILDMYSFEHTFDPIPDSTCFPEGFDQVYADDYNRRVGEKMRAGMEDVCGRISKLTNEFREVLGRDKPKFFQSTLDNVSQMTETLRLANSVVGSGDVTGLTDALESMCQYSAAQLKDNMTARQQTTLYCDACITALNAVLSVQPLTDEAPEIAPSSPRTIDELILTVPVGVTPEPEPEVVEPEPVEPDDGMLSLDMLDFDSPAPKTEAPKSLIEEIAGMDEEDLVTSEETEEQPADDDEDFLGSLLGDF